MVKPLAASIARRTLKISNGKKERTLPWGEFSFIYVGVKHVDTIRRINDELTESGKSSWIDREGNEFELTAVDWWPKP